MYNANPAHRGPPAVSKSTAGSKTIFVANIPYDVTEEQLATKFSEVGPVQDFVLKFDPATGRAKGYGFCHYFDHETALSAVRNLQEVQVNGRTLRVELSTDEPGPKKPRPGGFVGASGPGGPSSAPMGPGGSREGGYSPAGGRAGSYGGGPGPGPGYGDAGVAGAGGPLNLQMLPAGQDVPRGQTAVDAITKTLAAIPQQKLEEILMSVKDMVSLRPDQARQLLNAHPQLAYALFQAMLLMNIVEPSVLNRIQPLPNPRAAPPPPAPAPVPAPYAQTPPYGGPPPPNPSYGAPPAGYPPYGGGPPPPAPTLPVQQQYGARPNAPPPPPPHGYGAPPAPSAYGQPPAMPPQQQQRDPLQNPAIQQALAQVPDDQRPMLVQVLQLTQQQVDALPMDHRAQVMQVRQQFGVA